MKPAWTDYPIVELGDVAGQMAPVRKCKVLSYDGNRYCRVEVGGVTKEIKAGYVYSRRGRIGEVRPISWRRLRKLYAITNRTQ